MALQPGGGRAAYGNAGQLGIRSDTLYDLTDITTKTYERNYYEEPPYSGKRLSGGEYGFSLVSSYPYVAICSLLITQVGGRQFESGYGGTIDSPNQLDRSSRLSLGEAEEKYTVSLSSRVNWIDNEAEVERYSDRVANSTKLHNDKNCRLSREVNNFLVGHGSSEAE